MNFYIGKLIAWAAIFGGSCGLAFVIGGAAPMFTTMLILGIILFLIEAFG